MSCSRELALCLKVRTDEVVADSLGLDAPKPEQRCVKREAFGFNSSISPQSVVDSLHIEAHLVDAPALSYLKIGGERVGRTRILAVDKRLILLVSDLSDSPCTVIYIMYDVVARSILMIPSHPWSQPCKPLSKYWGQRPTALASRILILRTWLLLDSSYALVSMAEMANYSSKCDAVQTQDVLYIWRTTFQHWDMITTKFPALFKGDNVAHSYTAVLTFPFDVWAVWVNLVRGIMYCSRDYLLRSSSRSSSNLKFTFIELPVKQLPQLPSHVLCAMELNSNMYRTMGPIGETSINFVTIDGFMEFQDFVDCTVTVWSLLQDMITWTKSFSICLGRLTEQEEFKIGGLSTDMVPMYPRLSTEDDVIYLMLGNYAPCCLKHEGSKHRCEEYVAVAGKALHLLRVDVRRGVLLDSVSLPDQAGVDFAVCDLRRYLCGTSNDDQEWL